MGLPADGERLFPCTELGTMSGLFGALAALLALLPAVMSTPVTLLTSIASPDWIWTLSVARATLLFLWALMLALYVYRLTGTVGFYMTSIGSLVLICGSLVGVAMLALFGGLLRPSAGGLWATVIELWCIELYLLSVGMMLAGAVSVRAGRRSLPPRRSAVAAGLAFVIVGVLSLITSAIVSREPDIAGGYVLLSQVAALALVPNLLALFAWRGIQKQPAVQTPLHLSGTTQS
ncbi:MAG: hypothetical protein HXY34_13355 [Candidatus Thorarchaeota archaeon]|nr:hypothetical protein [Candidatus Thorarchaeota archaeon]